MEFITQERFLKRIRNLGIDFDERYPGSYSLDFTSHCDFARFWVLDVYPFNWPLLIDALMNALDPWDQGVLYPRLGQWPTFARNSPLELRAQGVMLKALGIPDGLQGASSFQQTEKDLLNAIMFIVMAFAGDPCDDLYFIPDHGRYFLMTSHHDVVHLKCSSEASIQHVVRNLEEKGWRLPTELPDETFKRPSWMAEVPK